jgi:hypothetical protein
VFWDVSGSCVLTFMVLVQLGSNSFGYGMLIWVLYLCIRYS